jgi:tRNA 2-selenouridine synthase
MQALKILEFLNLDAPLYDVRSPYEFSQGHIPQAQPLPLLNNSERKHVGTIYKKQNPTTAYSLAATIISSKLPTLIHTIKQHSPHSPIKFYCSRGGLRSQSLALLSSQYGFPAFTCIGGYKAFRNWSLQQFKKPWKLHIITGFTGVGKTEYLYKLKKHGEQIIDLEQIAQHKGSVFGNLKKSPQPSVEHFENSLAHQLHTLNPHQNIWIEDESRLIGSCKIPDAFYKQMQNAPKHSLELPKPQRIEKLFKEYSNATLQDVIEATKLLKKRLGHNKTETIINLLKQKNAYKAIELLLEYYDKRYTYSLTKNAPQGFPKLAT